MVYARSQQSPILLVCIIENILGQKQSISSSLFIPWPIESGQKGSHRVSTAYAPTSRTSTTRESAIVLVPFVQNNTCLHASSIPSIMKISRLTKSYPTWSSSIFNPSLHLCVFVYTPQSHGLSIA